VRSLSPAAEVRRLRHSTIRTVPWHHGRPVGNLDSELDRLVERWTRSTCTSTTTRSIRIPPRVWSTTRYQGDVDVRHGTCRRGRGFPPAHRRGNPCHLHPPATTATTGP
jgi:hypothetical protein